MKVLILFLITLSHLSLADSYKDYQKYRDQENVSTQNTTVLSPQEQMHDGNYVEYVPEVREVVTAGDYQLPVVDIEDKKINISCVCIGVNVRSSEKISVLLSDESEDEFTAFTNIQNECQSRFSTINKLRRGDYLFDLNFEVEVIDCQ